MQADFRLKWNLLSLGFSGVWHYKGFTDFEYVYKIYTPLKNFEENGVVGKLIIIEGIDMEMSVQFSIYKVSCVNSEACFGEFLFVEFTNIRI